MLKHRQVVWKSSLDIRPHVHGLDVMVLLLTARTVRAAVRTACRRHAPPWQLQTCITSFVVTLLVLRVQRKSTRRTCLMGSPNPAQRCTMHWHISILWRSIWRWRRSSSQALQAPNPSANSLLFSS